MHSTDSQKISYDSFLASFKKSLKRAFYEKDDITKFTQKRGFPDPVLKEIMDQKPLAVAIPSEYGGRGVHVKECLGLLEASSYESLPLSLTFGINIALFLEPLAKYGQEGIKTSAFKRFVNEQNMGGLMITEPDYGSDALNMQTSCEPEGAGYRIKGTKHWQGLTGMANYWLMACRSKNENGDLRRDLEFFITDEQAKGQEIKVSEYFNNIGLYPIPYGKNEVDILVPAENKLIPESTGLKLMMDLLHRSRLQFPGMGIGFIKRLLDEAVEHCKTRVVSGNPLFNLDQIKFRISQMQSAFTVASAMCLRSTAVSGINNNVAAAAVEANSMKAYVTDLMQHCAQILTQLKGAEGYKEESTSARGIVDSRPFQIFEGSNEMLYTQISEMVLKLMGRKKFTNIADFLPNYELTDKVSSFFASHLNFTLDFKLPQRKMVELGRVFSRIISANYVIDLGDKGFRNEMITECLDNLLNDVKATIGSFKSGKITQVDEGYNENSAWLAFC